MKSLPLPPELKTLFASRIAAHNAQSPLPIALTSLACYVDGQVHFSLIAQSGAFAGEVVEGHTSSAPFSVALDAAIARFVFNHP